MCPLDRRLVGEAHLRCWFRECRYDFSRTSQPVVDRTLHEVRSYPGQSGQCGSGISATRCREDYPLRKSSRRELDGFREP